jgi:hypothetical protein
MVGEPRQRSGSTGGITVARAITAGFGAAGLCGGDFVLRLFQVAGRISRAAEGQGNGERQPCAEQADAVHDDERKAAGAEPVGQP